MREPRHSFRKIVWIAQKITRARRAEVSDSGGDHYHPVRVLIEHPRDNCEVVSNFPLRPGVYQLPIGLFWMIAVVNQLQALEVFEKCETHLPNRAQGPFVVEGPD